MSKMEEFQNKDSYYQIKINQNIYQISKKEVFFDSPMLFFKYLNSYKCFILEDGKNYYLHINGKYYTVAKKQEKIKKEISLNIKELFAPLPGTITKIYVRENQNVQQGEILMIIESMKMENQILSPKEGKIRKILVTTNQKVEVNQLLIQFQE